MRCLALSLSYLPTRLTVFEFGVKTDPSPRTSQNGQLRQHQDIHAHACVGGGVVLLFSIFPVIQACAPKPSEILGCFHTSIKNYQMTNNFGAQYLNVGWVYNRLWAVTPELESQKAQWRMGKGAEEKE